MKHILLSLGSDPVVNLKSIHEDLGREIQNRLHNGIGHFLFVKTDGSVREAYGTTNPELITKLVGPPKETTTVSKSKDAGENITYYDFDAKTFRSFKMSTVVAVL